MADKANRQITERESADAVGRFLADVATRPKPEGGGGRGRLLFALDATASRQPTWDLATQIQTEMFTSAAAIGSFELQLCFYRGLNEFKASPWLTSSPELRRLMTSVACRAGRTQIGKVLQHAVNEQRRRKVAALVFVGDCAEEPIDELADRAGALGLLGVPAFMFQEGSDVNAALAFKEIARLTRGAYCRFDAGSAQALKDLLAAVAVYVAGGRRALEDHAAQRGADIRLIARQLDGR